MAKTAVVKPPSSARTSAPCTMVAPVPARPVVTEAPSRGLGPKCRLCGSNTTNEGVRQLRDPHLVRIRYECKNHKPPAVFDVITLKANCRQS